MKILLLEDVVKNYQGKIGFYDKNNKPIVTSIKEPPIKLVVLVLD